MAGDRFNLWDGCQGPASPALLPFLGTVALGCGRSRCPCVGLHGQLSRVQPLLGVSSPPTTEQRGCWLRDAPWLQEVTGARAVPRQVLLLLLALLRNRKAKEGYKGKMMSQKPLEGWREKQQACYWKQSHPEFSKQLLAAESSLRSGYRCSPARRV